MDVLAEVLSPGVENGRDPELAAEVAWITSEGPERVDCALEQEVVDQAGAALGEGVEGVGQREDDVEVLDG
jgi:hypothetical protein